MGSLYANKHEELAESLRGKEITVPNLSPFWEKWPQAVNPHHVRLQKLTDERIDSFKLSQHKIVRCKNTDIAFMVSCYWPHASWEAAVIIMQFITWLFIWDDEIDLGENEAGVNLDAAQAFRQESLEFIEHSLGLKSGNCAVGSQNPIIYRFEEVGAGLRRYYSKGQRRRFCDEIKFYFDMTLLEQKHKISDDLPSLEEYFKYRMGSSGVYGCVLLAELALGQAIPSPMLDHPGMRIVWDGINSLISISNDVLSLKKELQSNAILGSVPLLCREQGVDVQSAVGIACEHLRSAVSRVDQAAARILGEYTKERLDHEKLVAYVNILRTNITGNYYWSVRTRRYLIPGTMQGDGSMVIML
ncbi:terpenoid synthase [Cadophora sp. DSE1049]|nr:terpenoid synthase [Cadophora sp. DSE1049]